jgi:hypothetical protein
VRPCRPANIAAKVSFARAARSTPPSRRPIIDPEDPWRQDGVLIAQLQKMYGSNDGRDWTDEQIDAVLDEIDRENEAIFLAWAKQRAAPEP